MVTALRFSSVARASLLVHSVPAVLMTRKHRVKTYSVPVVLISLGLILIVVGNYFPNGLISLTGAALTLLGVGSYYYRKYSYQKRPT